MCKGPRAKTSKRTIETRERHTQWVKERKTDTLEVIAERHGVTPSAVHQAITKYVREVVQEPARELVQHELEQLEELRRAIWSRAMGELPDDLESLDAEVVSAMLGGQNQA